MKKLLTSVALLALAVPCLAETHPRGNASASVGGKTVTIDYGRPALKGRSLDELIKQLGPDRMWRAGSEQVTTLTSTGDLVLGGTRLPAGKYSLYLHLPEGGDAALAVNKDAGVPLGQIYAKAPEDLKNELWPRLDYSKIVSQEVARVALRKATPNLPEDQFTIGLSPSKDGAELRLSWGDRTWTTDVSAAR